MAELAPWLLLLLVLLSTAATAAQGASGSAAVSAEASQRWKDAPEFAAAREALTKLLVQVEGDHGKRAEEAGRRAKADAAALVAGAQRTSIAQAAQANAKLVELQATVAARDSTITLLTVLIAVLVAGLGAGVVFIHKAQRLATSSPEKKRR